MFHLTKQNWQLHIILLFYAVLTACASSQNKEVYNHEGEHSVAVVKKGVVTEVNEIMLAGRVTPIGNTTLGTLGRVAGASAGSTGPAAQILATLGGMIGSIVGATAEESMTRKKGQEIYIDLHDSDETIKVIQQLSEKPFATGDEVKVIQNGAKSRVTHVK